MLIRTCFPAWGSDDIRGLFFCARDLLSGICTLVMALAQHLVAVNTASTVVGFLARDWSDIIAKGHVWTIFAAPLDDATYKSSVLLAALTLTGKTLKKKKRQAAFSYPKPTCSVLAL